MTESPLSNEMMAQLRKGVIEYCLLALLENAPRHGYDLVAELAGTKMMALTESTVYPALARLRAKGLVETHSAPSERGPPRKMIALSPAGLIQLGAWRACWTLFENDINFLTRTREEIP